MRPESLVIIFLLAISSKTVQGQYDPMIADGKYWIYLNYYISGDDFLPVSGHAITFEGDTLINSINYKKVYKHLLKGGHACMYPPCWQFTYPYQTESKSLIAFIREDTIARKIFNLPIPSFGFCDTAEHLIFDYSLGIDDTVNSCIYDFIGASYITETIGGIVDSIGALQLFGKTRNTIFTTGYDNVGQDFAETRISIVEGVGLEAFGIFLDRLSPLVDFCESGMGPCELILSNSTIESNNEVNIFPNPTKGIVQISSKDEEIKTIRIYSILGAFKTEFLRTHEIDLGKLEGGIYLLELTSENGGRMVKKIIKEN